MLFRIISMLVSFEPAAACTSVMQPGISIAPLPARKQLWEARTETEWNDLCVRERGRRTDFGMTVNGELVSIDVQQPDLLPIPNIESDLEPGGLQSSNDNWEEWCAGMDGFGSLVMLAASLPAL